MNKRTISLRIASTLAVMALAVAACGSEEVVLAQQPGMADQLEPPTTEPSGDSVPDLVGEPASSSDPAEWNTPVDPTIVIDGVPLAIAAELPVVLLPGPAVGGGILDAGASIIGADDEYVYLGVGGTAGCASFEHLALVPMGLAGLYELFQDTDNTCEAAQVSGYRTPIADLTPAEDGTITIRNANGTTSTFTLD